jgi:hypothetical protein
MFSWLQDFFDVMAEDISPYVAINEVHAPRIGKVVLFWSNLLGFPTSQFHTTFIHSKHQKVYENHDTYYGVLSLGIKKSTFIKYKVLALIEALVFKNSLISKKIHMST